MLWILVLFSANVLNRECHNDSELKAAFGNRLILKSRTPFYFKQKSPSTYVKMYEYQLDGREILEKQYIIQSLDAYRVVMREISILFNLLAVPNIIQIEFCTEGYTRQNQRKVSVFMPKLGPSLEKAGMIFYQKSWKEKTELIRRLAFAMYTLHYNNIVQGDVKPENLVFTLDYKDIVIIDFELSVPIGGALAGGSPIFIPPEYGSKGSGIATAAGDVWSFIITVYTMLVPSLRSTLANIVPQNYLIAADKRFIDTTTQVVRMEAMKSRIPFDEIVLRWLRYSPRKRPTMVDIYLDCEQLAELDKVSSKRRQSTSNNNEKNPKIGLPPLPNSRSSRKTRISVLA